jgi:hypothetical protein
MRGYGHSVLSDLGKAVWGGVLQGFGGFFRRAARVRLRLAHRFAPSGPCLDTPAS